jgi:cell wall-associated NlpC family hydrolase
MKAVATAATLTATTATVVVTTHAPGAERAALTANAIAGPSEIAESEAATARQDMALARASRTRAAAATATTIRQHMAAVHRRAVADETSRVRTARAERIARADRASRSRRLASKPTAARTSSSRSSDAGQGALAEAPSHRGAPYQYGAEGPDRFDCSGFTKYLFGHQGAQLPRTASEQYAASSRVDQADKKPGDLIFTYDSSGIYHVGLYAGDGLMWAATKSGDVVRKQAIWTSSYRVGRIT